MLIKRTSCRTTLTSRWRARGFANVVTALVVAAISASISVLPVHAADSPNGTGLEDAPPWARAAGAASMAVAGNYSGHSGVDPYNTFKGLDPDAVFIADTGGKLDRYLFRSSGPLTFDLDITRVFGDVANLSQRMIENGLINKNATLYLRVYDVDHDYQGSTYAPEADLVSVNGHKLARRLTSGNNRWDTVSYQVPIEHLKFPSTPPLGDQPRASNTISIDIDTANTDQVWAVEVDWAALHIEAARPAVLVNGIRSDEHAWDTFGPLLKDRGLPNYALSVPGYQDRGLLFGGVFDNAGVIAARLPEIKKMFGVGSVNIIAHSKGGLDSRAYMRTHSDVDSLIQLATPNRGSDCANHWYNLLWPDLDPDWIHDNFNYRDTRKWFWEAHNWVPNWSERGKAPIFIYAATQKTNQSCDLNLGKIDPPHDGFVSQDRATLPWNWNGVDLDGSGQGNTDNKGAYDHSGILNAAVADDVVQWIASSSSTSGSSVPANATGLKSDLTPEETTQMAAVDETRLIEAAQGSLTAGASVTRTFAVDATSAKVLVIHGDEATNVRLTAPDGTTAVSAVTAEPSVVGLLTLFELDPAQAGVYTLAMSTPVADVFALEVRTEEGMSLNAQVTANTVVQGEDIQFSASLGDPAGAPVAEAAVTVELYEPNGTSRTVALTESSPGVYTGHIAAEVSGAQRAFVRANKAGQQRAAVVEVSVAPAGAALLSTTESTSDGDGDGLYDSLVLTVSATVPVAGNYVLNGDLYDANGNLIQMQALAVDAAAGSIELPLSFDGSVIHAQGVDGPYTLRDVVLSSMDLGGLPVAVLDAPYVTQPYGVAQFQHAQLRQLGGSDQGQDTDGDGLFDTLTVALEIEAEVAGTYDVSGRLVTATGEELDWSSQSVALDGQGTAILSFEGQKIRAGGVGGPYELIDLMISGPGTLIDPHAYTTAAYLVRAFQSIGPDLVVVPDRITTDPAPASPGRPVDLSAVVENRGGDPVGAFAVTFYLGNPAQGGTPIGETTVEGIAAENESRVSVQWTTPADPGLYEVYVVLNSARTVTEFNYANNTSSRVLAVNQIDKDGPVITWASPIADGASFVFGAVPVAPTCTAWDEGSGVNAAGCLVSGHATGPGVHTLTATATDNAGNTTTERRSYAVRFLDVPEGVQFHDEMMWLATHGISTGWPDGTFRPTTPINRDAMAAFVYRLSGSPDFTPTQQTFVDVPSGAQFYKEIEWLASQGIATGWDLGDGRKEYRPVTSINRDAIAAFAYRLNGEPGFTPTRQTFVDVTPEAAFYKEIEWLADAGITTGWPDGSYRPVTPVNRDAMAAFLYRYVDQLGFPR